ncbi:hypothetical protein BJ138DRAFT_1149976 [Hygrophoropsis aurantiaca]|uniref:Uncharacterized protein n=1 Tax=Hygrophoropsis aurantiaca TaxID=72124 RepID=A0ACB8AGK0_9AGAM|nr:hypothetical protein BJ138DRAFT_1149976 [Hygrophoropsis aurantiaca]
MAGMGKSAIAQTVAERYAEQHRLAASFFFSKRESERSNTHNFVPTIVSHIITFTPAFKPIIARVLDNDPLILTKVLREQLTKLVLLPLQEMKSSFSHPIVIVIDSLDECDGRQLVIEVVSFLSQLVRACTFLRIFITSRGESYIRRRFTDTNVAAVTHRQELHNYNASNDIQIFFRHTFKEISARCLYDMYILPNPWPSELELSTLVNQASGLFIYATTVTNFINSTGQDPQKQLKIVLAHRTGIDFENSEFSVLDALYRDAVNLLRRPDQTRHALGIICCIVSPLPIRALEEFIALSDAAPALVISELRSVLMVPDNRTQPIHIYHESFRDFLFDRQRSNEYFVDEQDYHPIITRCCLELMLNHLKRNICCISDPFLLNSEVQDLSDRREMYMGDALCYAISQWSHHLTRISGGGTHEDLALLLRKFIRTSLLYWIEALSLLGALEGIFVTMDQTIHFLRSHPDFVDAEAMNLLEDANRLVMMFFYPISQSALQIYHSALPFTPLLTQIRKTYHKELAGGIVVRQGLTDNWDTCVQTISVSSQIESIAFSPDGSLIASANRQSQKGVQLWNAITRANVADLIPPNCCSRPSVNVCFSPSGKYVAIGFENGAIACWNVLTTQCLVYDEDLRRGEALFLVFSPNSYLLAAACVDGQIQLWDMATSNHLDCKYLHQYHLGPVVFSSESRFLVAGGREGYIVVYNVDSRKVERKFEGTKGRVTSIALSSDDMCIACGSHNGGVRVWDLETALCISEWFEHRLRVHLVRFTPDDERVISSSDDTIGSVDIVKRTPFKHIWSQDLFETFRSERSAHLHPAPPSFTSNMSSIVFSDRSLVFCVELDPFAPSVIPSPAFAEAGRIACSTISPDGDRIACGYTGLDQKIRIWNPALRMKSWDEFLQHTEKKEHSGLKICGWEESPNQDRHLVRYSSGEMLLHDHNDDVIKAFPGNVSISASPDWTVFAYNSPSTKFNCDSVVTIWDSKSGMSTSLSNASQVRAYAFSDDSTLLAVHQFRRVDGTFTNGVVVWDIATGQQRLNIPTGVSTFKFSPDTTTLAVGTRTGVVQLWDIQKCHLREELRVTGDNTHTGVESIAFSPDSSCIVFGDTNQFFHFCRLSFPTRIVYQVATKDVRNAFSAVFVNNEATIASQRRPNGILHLAVPQEMLASNAVRIRTTDSKPSCVPAKINQSLYLDWCGEEDSIYPDDLSMGHFIRADGWVFCDSKKVLWLHPGCRPRHRFYLSLGNKRMVMLYTLDGISGICMVVDFHQN